MNHYRPDLQLTEEAEEAADPADLGSCWVSNADYNDIIDDGLLTHNYNHYGNTYVGPS